MSEKGSRKDKNQNIQVFVRLRPLNQRERDIKSLGVVEVVSGREVVVRQSQQTCHTKRFTFDRAFPPSAKQVEVYQEVVSPLIEEVLNGYNCTVFAYGQTGTGKTHTMVGENSGNETTWQNDPLAGIIPRALSQLFDELRISNTEYTVRVSYLELYNEELFDLLSTSEDNSKLRIYEDVTRKGSNIVNGLEEITVYNKTEVYKIMAQGQERKRVASTLMNAQSSRSHTVFTIVVHMRENSPEGEELVKIGKLNLVDLAGSENISKAGSDNPAKKERARECVNINQSLLTLGRVITALVERHPHIPYRESKLTRILQESLGGRTKTSIIATISPGHKDLEETMSTLDYANRAKNIQNKPEVNQKMTKKAIMKEYVEEIDRLKRDLQAARDKNGVFLANETYAEMTLKQEEQRKEIQELLLKKRAMEEERDRMQAVFDELAQQLQDREAQLSSTADKLCTTRSRLTNTCNLLKTSELKNEESKHLVSKQLATERALTAQARELLAAADAATTDASRLHDTVDKRRTVESTNLEITKSYRDVSAHQRDNITQDLDKYISALTRSIGTMITTLETFTSDCSQTYATNKQILHQLAQAIMDLMNKISDLRTEAYTGMTTEGEMRKCVIEATLQQHADDVEALLRAFASCMRACVQRTQDFDLRGDLERFLRQWHAEITSMMSSMRASHEIFKTQLMSASETRRDCAVRQYATARDRAQLYGRLVKEQTDLFIAEKEETDKRLAQEIEKIEIDIAEVERQEVEWIVNERRLTEERIQRYMADQKNVKHMLNRRIECVKEQHVLFKEKTTMQLEWFESLVRESEITLRIAEEDLKQNIEEIEQNMKDVNETINGCAIACNTVSSIVDGLSEHALQIVDSAKVNFVNELQQINKDMEEESNKLMNKNTELTKQLQGTVDTAVSAVIQRCESTVDSIVNHVNETSSSTNQQLSSLSSSTSCLATAITTHQGGQSQSMSTAQHELQVLYDVVREKVARLAEMQEQFLSQKYTIYSPTGRTPVRTQYSYPRALAATSPHERILARFRAMRQNSNDDDCIVVEGDSESRVSDTDSSASDDSAVAFAVPSATDDSAVNFAAPSPLTASLQEYPPIIKSTSETDIYHRRRQDQQGKENANRSISFKKPSKLRAPSFNKKPLIDRNDNN